MVADPIKDEFVSSPTYLLNSNWYLDKDLTLIGGTYNTNANTLIPNAAAIDSSIFYFEVVDNTCSPPFVDTMSVDFENPIVSACGNITWTGGKGLWMDASKWDKNRLPNVCDSVIIANVLDSVQLQSAAAVTLSHIENSGNLAITANSELKVENAAIHAVINAGVINVQGSLTIDHATENGFVSLANSALVNSGNISISNSGKNALFLTNCIAQNKPGGQISLENSILANILLKQNSIFFQEGGLLSE